VGEKERRGMMRKPSVNERYIRTLKNSVRTPVRTVCVGLRDYADRIHGRKCHAIMGRSHVRCALLRCAGKAQTPLPGFVADLL